MLRIRYCLLFSCFPKVSDGGLRTKSRSAKHISDPGPPKTQVTYNESLVIQCMDSSPFVMCHGRPSPRSDVQRLIDRARHKPWRFALFAMAGPLLRHLEWNFRSCPYNNCVDDSVHLAPDTDIIGYYGQNLRRFAWLDGGSNQSRMFIMWESPEYTGSSFQWGKSSGPQLFLLLP